MAETKATPAEPLFSFRKDDLVTILVGPGEEEFAVHEHVVTRSSEFFKAAMKKEWTEGQARIIKLPEETHVQNFIHYLNFTYREQLHTEHIKAGDAYGPGCPMSDLVRLYVLDERMLDTAAQNAVISEMIRLTTIRWNDGQRRFPHSALVTLIYNESPTGSSMRRLMVDMRVAEEHQRGAAVRTPSSSWSSRKACSRM